MTVIKFLEYILCGPLFIFLLLGTGIFYTFYLKFPQIRFFFKSCQLLFKKNDNKTNKGEISRLQTITTSLGGSIGIGCIAGTGIAINIGGPSSIFWMLLSTFFSMATKYVEVTLSHKYREKALDGSMSGAPMYFINKKLKMPKLAYLMGFGTIIYACAFANMPQSNTISKALNKIFNIHEFISGIIMTTIIAIIIFGGVKRISKFAEKLIPLMFFIYVIIATSILFKFSENIIPSLKLIFLHPFKSTSALGGFLGANIMVSILQGVNRSYYTNDAGSGASGIAHSASKESDSVKEGISSIIEPFICTIIICFLTSMVILTAGTWKTKYVNKFQNYDMSFRFKNSNTKDYKRLPPYNGFLKIEDGIIQNNNITLLVLNSVAENLTVLTKNKLFTGNLKIINGKIPINMTHITIKGKSLISGIMSATMAFKYSPFGKISSYLLAISIILFALTTILTWFYYGDRGLTYFKAKKKVLLLYKIIFILVYFIGSIINDSLVWNLTLISYALMGIPSLIGILFMHKEIKSITPF